MCRYASNTFQCVKCCVYVIRYKLDVDGFYKLQTVRYESTHIKQPCLTERESRVVVSLSLDADNQPVSMASAQVLKAAINNGMTTTITTAASTTDWTGMVEGEDIVDGVISQLVQSTVLTDSGSRCERSVHRTNDDVDDADSICNVTTCNLPVTNVTTRNLPVPNVTTRNLPVTNVTTRNLPVTSESFPTALSRINNRDSTFTCNDQSLQVQWQTANTCCPSSNDFNDAMSLTECQDGAQVVRQRRNVKREPKVRMLRSGKVLEPVERKICKRKLSSVSFTQEHRQKLKLRKQNAKKTLRRKQVLHISPDPNRSALRNSCHRSDFSDSKISFSAVIPSSSHGSVSRQSQRPGEHSDEDDNTSGVIALQSDVHCSIADIPGNSHRICHGDISQLSWAAENGEVEMDVVSGELGDDNLRMLGDVALTTQFHASLDSRFVNQASE